VNSFESVLRVFVL